MWLAARLLLLLLSEPFEAINILCASREKWKVQTSGTKRALRCPSASELHRAMALRHCEFKGSVPFTSAQKFSAEHLSTEV